MAKALMVQGTGSDVGKSLLVAGLCRAYMKRGLKVRPFKPQNMSNNAAVTPDGKEIGRAQALQALACGVDNDVRMNPVLLKPEQDRKSQLVVMGEKRQSMSARDYFAFREQLMPEICDAFESLASECDLVLVEGAGSPAEVNLRANDIANMGFARALNLPVILVGDIDRGGVMASLIGTLDIIAPEDATHVKALMVNKFRGDVSLFDSGRDFLTERSGLPVLGVVPFYADALSLPPEDSMSLELAAKNAPAQDGDIVICVPQLSRMANFDDCDPLRLSPNVQLEFCPPGQPLNLRADAIILCGSKATIAEMDFIKQQGWDVDLRAYARQGGVIVGICGGMQLLGKKVSDPKGIEGVQTEIEGLCLLDIETELRPQKTVQLTDAIHSASGKSVRGYEIHLGVTQGLDCDRAPFSIDGRQEGAANPKGTIWGTYLHGLFANDGFREDFLNGLSVETTHSSSTFTYNAHIEKVLDGLADHLAHHVDLDRLLALASTPQRAKGR